MLKIALFGTSADPPTTGHQTIICWLSEHYDRVAVWASDNPMKVHASTLEQRSAMLLMLIKEMNWQHNVSLHPELSDRRTLESVKKAKRRWPQAELTLTIGSDLVNQLPYWYRVKDLLQQVRLLVVPRPGYSIEDAGLQRLRSMGTVVGIANLDAPDVSSTAYREKGDTRALTPPIEEYIHREQLYNARTPHQANQPIAIS